ncbi:Alpha/Beta hydrolase protein [Ilyonectria robusta]|uniref:Alpha/Beta hydrolase protein n=1 Tax=Ilyonectria robusta TaxID=1079257 RepID=UPI001E8EB32A|nr:Alpha/Beta hydrolase protein [Ilyonectria robusta]KAH8654735.1 Alpha/Beta hydrolase protein [Ilyonectria robusta]
MSCPDCFRGAVSTTQTTGTETTIHGFPTYVAQPENGATTKGIIVIITDAFGWKFSNNRVLCDRYAKRGGFLVYCPDFMSGSSMDPRAIALLDNIMEPAPWFDTIFYKPITAIQWMTIALPWILKTRLPVTRARVFSFIQALRTSSPPFPTNNLKIGVAGFCWGGKHTLLLAQDEPSSRVRRHNSQINSANPEPLIDCAFTAHPALIEVPRDIEDIAIPTNVAIGDEDTFMKVSLVKQMKHVLEVENKGSHEVTILPGARHGFAVRARPDNEHEMECAEKAEVQAIDWFTRWLART